MADHSLSAASSKTALSPPPSRSGSDARIHSSFSDSPSSGNTGDERRRTADTWRRPAQTAQADPSPSSSPKPSLTRKVQRPKRIESGYIVLLPVRKDIDISFQIHKHPDFKPREDPSEKCGFGHPALILRTDGGKATCFPITSFEGTDRDVKYHGSKGARARAAMYVEIGKKFDNGKIVEPPPFYRFKDFGLDSPVLKLSGRAGMNKKSYVNVFRTFEIEEQHLVAFNNSDHQLGEGELERLTAYWAQVKAEIIDKGLLEERETTQEASKDTPPPSPRPRYTQHRQYQSCGQQSNRVDKILGKEKWR